MTENVNAPPIGLESGRVQKDEIALLSIVVEEAASAPVASQRLPRQRLPNDSNMKMINSMSQIVIIADTIAPPLCSSQDVRSPAPGPDRRGAVLRLEIASGGGNL
jgi:hypothetical protein